MGKLNCDTCDWFIADLVDLGDVTGSGISTD